MIRIGASAGLLLRYVGRVGKFGGSSPPAALIAACTSRAAASTLRSRSNCSVICDEPSELTEVISFTPAMRPKRRSSGVATAEAIVSGLAPGKLPVTLMTGKSTRGSGATGSSLYAAAPASNTATASSEVATGRRMKGSEIFTVALADLRSDSRGLESSQTSGGVLGDSKHHGRQTPVLAHSKHHGRSWHLVFQ